MSDRQRKLFNRRAGNLLIAGAFLFLVIIVVVRVLSPSTPEPESVKERTDPEPHRVRLASPKVFDAEAFKRTIIDNNIFRPLGWTPPRPVEPYRLLGTKLSLDANTPPKAIIQSIAGEKTYIVTTGEPLDALTEVVWVESKSVVVSTDGEHRTLHLPIGF